MPTSGEGPTIRRLLAERKITLARLAAAFPPKGIEPSGLRRYLDVEVVGDRGWPRLKEALQKLGIDPALVRSEPTIYSHGRAVEPSRDFRPALAAWSQAQLATLRDILRAPDSHLALIYWIDGKLSD